MDDGRLQLHRCQEISAPRLIDCQVKRVSEGRLTITFISHLMMTPTGPEMASALIRRYVSDREAEQLVLRLPDG